MKKLVLSLILCSFFAATSVFGQVAGVDYGNITPYSTQNSPGNVSLGTFYGKFGAVKYAAPDFYVRGSSSGTSIDEGGILVDAGAYTGIYSRTSTGTAIWGNSATGLAGRFDGLTQFNGQANFLTQANFNFTQFNGNANFLANVGIGTSNPQKLLHVQNGEVLIQNGRLLLSDGQNQIELKSDGLIHAREIEVDLVTIPDYVFEDDYNLMPLTELQKFIDLNKHLPNIKSAAEYEAHGSIPLKELNLKLLEKVEELTLYTLEQEKEIEALKAANAEIEILKKQIVEMQVLLEKMTNK